MKNYFIFKKNYDSESFGLRLSVLRQNKGVSARKMSLTLGQNQNYINAIESGKYFPTMQCFFAICKYLQVTPAEFFKAEEEDSEIDETAELLTLLYCLPPHIEKHFYQLICDYVENCDFPAPSSYPNYKKPI